MRLKRRWNLSAAAKFALLLAPWAFIAYLFRDVGATLDSFRNASVVPMVGGLLLTMMAIVGMALLWVRLVAHLNRDIAVPNTLHLLRSYARSWLARYLPGKVWSYGARVIHTDASVTPRRILAVSLVDEFALIVGSHTALGLGLWMWAVAGVMVGVPVLLGGLATVIVAVSRLDQLIKIMLRFLGRAVPPRWRLAGDDLQRASHDPGLGLRASLLFTLGYMSINFTGGLAFVLVVASLGNIGWDDVPLLAGVYSLAAVISFVAVFAPAGLGVREAILSGFLTPVVTASVAASAAVSMRAVIILADILFVTLVESLVRLSTFTSRGTATPASTAGQRTASHSRSRGHT